MAGVKIHQPRGRRAVGEKTFPPLVDEETLDEVLPQWRIVEAPFLLHRQQREMLGEARGEEAAAVAARHAPVAVDADAEEPAARRAFFEHVAVEVPGGDLRHLRARPSVHPLGQVVARARLDEPWRIHFALETDRGPRDAETDLHLGAEGKETNVGAEHAGQEAVVLVPAVEAHLLAEQTRADADAQLGARLVRRSLEPLRQRCLRELNGDRATGPG